MSLSPSSRRRFPLGGGLLFVTAVVQPFPSAAGGSGDAQASPGDARTEPALTVLERSCLRCHTDEKRKGGLLLASREALLEGGDSGPALVPGRSSESLLVEVLFPDADPHMPPKSQLDPVEIQSIEAWIDAGAAWDAELWERLRTARHTAPVDLDALPAAFQPALAVALSPDGRWLAAGRGATIEVFDLSLDVPEGSETREPSARLDRHRDAVQSLAWSRDGTRLASGGFRRVVVWKASPEGSFVPAHERSAGLAGRITALEFAADGGRLVVADSVPAARSQLHWWRPADDDLVTIGSAHDDTIFDIEISPDGRWLASASADQHVHLRRADDGGLAGTLEGHTGFVLALAFSPGSDRLVTGGDDASIRVWNLETRKQVITLDGDPKATGPVTALAWMIDPEAAKRRDSESDEDKKASINTDRIVAIREIGQPVVLTSLNEHEGAESSRGASERTLTTAGSRLGPLALDPRSGALYAGSPDGDVHSWDASGKLAPVRRVPRVETAAAESSPPRK